MYYAEFQTDKFIREKYNPTVVLLENFLHNKNYVSYMESKNYTLEKAIEYNYIFTKSR